MTLLSLPDFRRRVGDLAVEHLDQAEILLAEVTAQFEQLTARKWEQSAGEVWLTRVNERSLVIWIPITPVTAVTLVESRLMAESAWSTIEATEYELVDGPSGELQRLARYWEDRVRITYTGGHTASTCPADVQNALVTQARFLSQRRRPEAIALKGKAMKDGSSEFMERADYHPLFKSVAASHVRRIL